MNIATTSRTTDTATCPPTSTARPQRRRRPGATASLAFITAVRSVRVAWIAGTRPNSTALATATTRLKSSARRSSWNDERDRQIGRNLNLPEQRHAGIADAEAEHAAGDGDQQALGDQLADQPAASGADGEPQRHLARANRRAAGQQPGDVGARDEQHRERERREHRDQHRVRRALRDPRLQLGAHGEAAILVRVRIGALEIRGDRRQLGSALRPATTPGLEASFEPQVPRVARLERRRPSDRSIRRGDIISGTKKSERTYWFMPVNSGGRHADHGELARR